MINIIGLGATDGLGLTVEATRYIEDDNKNFLRTDKVGAIDAFSGHPFETFDDLYETMEDFDSVYRTIVERLIEAGRDATVNYFVPGSPMVAEKTVRLLIEEGVALHLVAGVSFLEPVFNAVHIDPSKGFILIDGDDFTPEQVDPRMDICITQVYNLRTAVAMKLALSEIYSDDYEVYYVRDAGLETEEVKKLPIYLIDRQDYNHRCVLVVPKSGGTTLGSLIGKLKESNPQVVKAALGDSIEDSFLKALVELVEMDRTGEQFLSESWDLLSRKIP
ncbi:SAM-dependent methyltransferase [Peptoniphilus equinus]|uniref:SAM-dependent methyltransferase n=1 Tax=Peptoniphilus equinus TaxID=3016343 RepID=A0ABY7QRT8_9FIRM|nr:SAM-dependent methyltransferase [Peptoniphilus equinus]WBW49502.1 SAM-dependent methyltransferase [Peptoniphilus equinus]